MFECSISPYSIFFKSFSTSCPFTAKYSYNREFLQQEYPQYLVFSVKLHLGFIPSPLSPLLPSPLSCIPYPLSCIPYPLASIPYPVSLILYYLSCIPYPVSLIPYLLSLPLVPYPLVLFLSRKLGEGSCCHCYCCYFVFASKTNVNSQSQT